MLMLNFFDFYMYVSEYLLARAHVDHTGTWCLWPSEEGGKRE